mgnify:CR=1 FL=1
MCAALRDLDPLDRGAADQARFACSPVHLVAILVVAGDAVGPAVVGDAAAAQRAAALANGRCQRLADGAVQAATVGHR